MEQEQRGRDFIAGIMVALLGDLLISAMVEIDNNIYENGSSPALKFWGFMFTVSSILFFQILKPIMADFGFRRYSRTFDFATIICAILGVVVIVLTLTK